MIVSEVNSLIFNSAGLLVIPSTSFGFDFAYSALPVVTDSQVDVYLNATFFDTVFGVVSPNEGFADLLIDTSTKACVQMDVSQYSIDSLFLTLHEAGILEILIDNTLIPSTSAFSLTTTGLESFFPGLVAAYGEDIPMSILAATHVAPRAFFDVDQIGMILSMDLHFNVEG